MGVAWEVCVYPPFGADGDEGEGACVLFGLKIFVFVSRQVLKVLSTMYRWLIASQNRGILCPSFFIFRMLTELEHMSFPLNFSRI
jgi:hypothetical protein